MFHDLKNVCLYSIAYVLLNQFARSSGSWHFYCHVIATAMCILGSSRCTEAAYTYVSCVMVRVTALEVSLSKPGVVFCCRCNWPMSTSPKYFMPAKISRDYRYRHFVKKCLKDWREGGEVRSRGKRNRFEGVWR